MPKYWKSMALYALLSGVFIGIVGTSIGLSVYPRFFLNLLSGFIIGWYYANKERLESTSK